MRPAALAPSGDRGAVPAGAHRLCPSRAGSAPTWTRPPSCASPSATCACTASAPQVGRPGIPTWARPRPRKGTSGDPSAGSRVPTRPRPQMASRRSPAPLESSPWIGPAPSSFLANGIQSWNLSHRSLSFVRPRPLECSLHSSASLELEL